MIKIAITIASFLISLLTFSQNVGKSSQGEFNGKLCDIGRGLCNTTPPNTNDKSASMKNYTTYKQSENTMVIELDINNLSLEDQKKFFGKEYSKISSNEVLTFVQDADFVFPIETLIYLGYNLSYRNLKKGEYPLAIIKDKILITLTLTKD
jgi:hypothetical protein